MKKLSWIILLLYISISASAQSETSISGLIQDIKGTPISYVNVGIVGTSTGTVSNEDGSYDLYFKDIDHQNDTLRFSIIGYKSQSILIKSIEDQQTIILEEETFELTEVVVRPELPNQKSIGRSKTNGNMNVNFLLSKKPRQNMGAEIGKKFKVENTPTKIQSLRFYVQSNNFSSVKFRIAFYSIKKNKPYKHLIDKDIIVEINEKKRGWIDVDLTTYDIFTKDDFIATVQWIDSSTDGKSLALPIRLPAFGSNHYYKFGSQAKWKRFRNMSISMTVGLAY